MKVEWKCSAKKYEKWALVTDFCVARSLYRGWIRIQWSEVRVTAVTVTVGYSDSFDNPRFIINKTPLLTVTKNRLQ